MRVGTPEECLKKLRDVTKAQRSAFVSVWAVGLLAHGYMFANKFPNHDDLYNTWGKGACYEIGRWLLPLVGRLDRSFSMPWLLGCLSLALLGTAALLLVEELGLESPVLGALAGGILVAFPTVTALFTFMFTSDAYALCLLLTFSSVAFARRGGWWALPAIACLTLSLGLYQAFFGWAVALLVLGLYQKSARPGAEGKKIFAEGLYDLTVLGAGMALYLSITKGLQRALGVAGSRYQGADAMGHVDPARLPAQIGDAYDWFFSVAVSPLRGIGASPLIRVLMAGCQWLLLALMVLGAARQFRRKKWLEGALAAAMTALFPLAVNVICLMGAQVIHTLMLYPMCMGVLGLLALCEEQPRQRGQERMGAPGGGALLRWGAAALVCLLTARCVLLANECYFNLQLGYTRKAAYWTTVVTQIKSLPGYTAALPVALVGHGMADQTFRSDVSDADILSLAGVGDAMAVRPYSEWQFLREYLGFYPPYCPGEDFAANETVAAMPCYPDDGAIAIVDGVVVVKFNES